MLSKIKEKFREQSEMEENIQKGFLQSFCDVMEKVEHVDEANWIYWKLPTQNNHMYIPIGS